jgi:membrane protease YdiL (CAAX protease family)
MPTLSDRRKAGLILGGLVLFQCCFLALYLTRGLHHFLVYLGFLAGRHTPRLIGWAASLLVAAGYIALCRRLPSVRAEFIRPSGLKLLAIALAVVAGCLEEIVFRAMLMDALANHGIGIVLQIILSGLLFGVAHGIWAFFRGSWQAGAGAIVATGILGASLAVVYIVGGRSLAPCVAAHFLLNIFAEPGLVLAAIRGEMGRGLRPPAPTEIS